MWFDGTVIKDYNDPRWKPSTKASKCCGDKSQTYTFSCTRDPGHDYPHIGHGMADTILGRWWDTCLDVPASNIGGPLAKCERCKVKDARIYCLLEGSRCEDCLKKVCTNCYSAEYTANSGGYARYYHNNKDFIPAISYNGHSNNCCFDLLQWAIDYKQQKGGPTSTLIVVQSPNIECKWCSDSKLYYPLVGPALPCEECK